MATINQLVRKPRRSKVTASNSAALKLVHKSVVYVLVYIQQHLRNQTLHYVK